MAGVVNHSARPYNLQVCSGGQVATVRLKPGFNIVSDAIWKKFEKDKYVLNLKKTSKIEWGKDTEEKKEVFEKEELVHDDVSKEEALPPNYNSSEDDL